MLWTQARCGRPSPWLLAALAIAATVVQPLAAQAQDAESLLRSAKGNDRIKFDPGATSAMSLVYSQDLDTGQGFREVYRMDLRRREAALLELTSDVFDARLRVLTLDGRLVASDEDSAGDKNARLLIAPTPEFPGPFLVVVESSDKTVEPGSEFDLAVKQRRMPKSNKNTQLKDVDRVVESFDILSPLDLPRQKLFETYTFEAVAGERVRIALRSKRLPLALELVRGAEVLVEESRGLGREIVWHRRMESAGPHVVRVLGSPERFGEYELSFARLPEPKANVLPEDVKIGSRVNGNFYPDSPLVSELSSEPYALFKLDGFAGGRVELAASPDEGLRSTLTAPLLIEVGVDTPVGFAAVRTASVSNSGSQGERRTVVDFDRDGPLLVRVTAPRDTIGSFVLAVDAVEGARGDVAPTAANNALPAKKEPQNGIR